MTSKLPNCSVKSATLTSDSVVERHAIFDSEKRELKEVMNFIPDLMHISMKFTPDLMQISVNFIPDLMDMVLKSIPTLMNMSLKSIPNLLLVMTFYHLQFSEMMSVNVLSLYRQEISHVFYSPVKSQRQ